MGAKPRRWAVVVVVVVALAVASAAAWALGSARGLPCATIGGEARGILAQFGVLTVVPIDPEKAFVEGYEAYRANDQMKAIERMTLAADKYRALADYALFFLGSAQRRSGDNQAAAAAFNRLSNTYPRSVFAHRAALEYAELELKLGHLAEAESAAAELALRHPGADIKERARLIEAKASLGSGDVRGAYHRLQALRGEYPGGSTDAEARTLAYSIIAQHPGLIDTHSLSYHRDEAALLLREGRPALALGQIDSALALGPAKPVNAGLLWLRSNALRAYTEREIGALKAYLKLAPRGAMATKALYRLGHLYWRLNDTATARAVLLKIPARFRESHLAPIAMFDAARTYEDDGKWDRARAGYLRLIERYPHSSAAAGARFRAPFALYMMGQFAKAARGFAAMTKHAESASDRDMFTYWHGRALERDGHTTAARAIYEALAQTTASNYYPALAALRVKAPAAQLAAADAPKLDPAAPARVAGPAEFHLRRAVTLKRLGLSDLEQRELRALAAGGLTNPGLRDFVLAEFQRTGAWYDAIKTAARLEKHGGLNAATAERLRYPRGYWDIIEPTAKARALDPYLVLALTRQESLFNPRARSVSDARGLMQLLESTAQRVGKSEGIGQASLNLYNPSLSVRLGTAYLAGLLKMFGDDPFRAVAAYNAGEHAVQHWNAQFPGDDDQWVENIGYRETRDYVKRVIGGLREYRMLYLSHASQRSEGRPAAQSQG